MRDLRRLLKYLRPHWPIFTLATLAMLIVGILESAIGGLIVPIFDQAFVPGAGQRTPTIFGLQHLIPQAPLEAWKMISILLIVFTFAKGIAEYLVDLSDGAYRAVGCTQIAAGSLQSPARTVSNFLRAASHQLSRLATRFERRGDRDRGYEHDSRHAAREFYVDRVSVGVLLLQLATHARLAR